MRSFVWKFSVLIIIQVATILTVTADVPIARQIIMFVYLAFVPGAIILSILRWRGLNTTETILLSVGLSIAFLMFIGLLMNELYPLLGISAPLATSTMLITLNIFVSVLYVAACLMDTDFPNIVINSPAKSPLIALLFIIPFMAIVGIILVNGYGNNFILLSMVVVISALILMTTVFRKLFPSRLYPLIIFAISLALLFHTSLMSNYIVGYDAHFEHYVFNIVQKNSYWNKAFPETYNNMLSVTILPTIFSNLLNMEGTWIFKIIYPLIFSLVPVGLYQAYQKQTGKIVALLAAVFFVSSSTFYSIQMLSLMRQIIAELFLVLLIGLLLAKRARELKTTALLIIFGAALIVSHYSVSYLFMFFLFIWLVLEIIKKDAAKRGATLNWVYALLFPVMALSWYIFISLSATFSAFVGTLSNVFQNFATEFLSPIGMESHVQRTIGLGTFPSFYHLMGSILVIITQILILIGFIIMIIRPKETKFNRAFLSMSIGSMIILGASIIIPRFSGILNVTRFYQLSLFMLAPLCILGGIYLFKRIEKIGGKTIMPFWLKRFKHKKFCIVLLSIVLITFFLFETGFVYEITGDLASSIPLSSNRFRRIQFYSAITSKQEVHSAKWLLDFRGYPSEVFADEIAGEKALVSYGEIRKGSTNDLTPGTVFEQGYVFLGSLNVGEGIIMGRRELMWNTTQIQPVLDEMNEIYNTGQTIIYWVDPNLLSQTRP